VYALLVTVAFPGIISPYEIDGEPFCDGGILIIFPIDLLQGHCETIYSVYESDSENRSQRFELIRSVTTRAFDIFFQRILTSKNSIFVIGLLEPKELSAYSTFENQ
jgi:NTE family protein